MTETMCTASNADNSKFSSRTKTSSTDVLCDNDKDKKLSGPLLVGDPVSLWWFHTDTSSLSFPGSLEWTSGSCLSSLSSTSAPSESPRALVMRPMLPLEMVIDITNGTSCISSNDKTKGPLSIRRGFDCTHGNESKPMSFSSFGAPLTHAEVREKVFLTKLQGTLLAVKGRYSAFDRNSDIYNNGHDEVQLLGYVRLRDVDDNRSGLWAPVQWISPRTTSTTPPDFIFESFERFFFRQFSRAGEKNFLNFILTPNPSPYITRPVLPRTPFEPIFTAAAARKYIQLDNEERGTGNNERNGDTTYAGNIIGQHLFSEVPTNIGVPGIHPLEAASQMYLEASLNANKAMNYLEDRLLRDIRSPPVQYGLCHYLHIKSLSSATIGCRSTVEKIKNDAKLSTSSSIGAANSLDEELIGYSFPPWYYSPLGHINGGHQCHVSPSKWTPSAVSVRMKRDAVLWQREGNTRHSASDKEALGVSPQLMPRKYPSGPPILSHSGHQPCLLTDVYLCPFTLRHHSSFRQLDREIGIMLQSCGLGRFGATFDCRDRPLPFPMCPPGKRIYHDKKGGISVFEVNSKNDENYGSLPHQHHDVPKTAEAGYRREYCRNLFLTAKSYLENKLSGNDVDLYIFYVVTFHAKNHFPWYYRYLLRRYNEEKAKERHLLSLLPVSNINGGMKPNECVTERVKTESSECFSDLQNCEQNFSFDPVVFAGFYSWEIPTLHLSTGQIWPNLACIVTLPCFGVGGKNHDTSKTFHIPSHGHSAKGLGSFLISLSYEIARRRSLIGTPERPLSDFGERAYLSYWKSRIYQFFTFLVGQYEAQISKKWKDHSENHFSNQIPDGRIDEKQHSGMKSKGSGVHRIIRGANRKRSRSKEEDDNTSDILHDVGISSSSLSSDDEHYMKESSSDGECLTPNASRPSSPTEFFFRDRSRSNRSETSNRISTDNMTSFTNQGKRRGAMKVNRKASSTDPVVSVGNSGINTPFHPFGYISSSSADVLSGSPHQLQPVDRSNIHNIQWEWTSSSSLTTPLGIDSYTLRGSSIVGVVDGNTNTLGDTSSTGCDRLVSKISIRDISEWCGIETSDCFEALLDTGMLHSTPSPTSGNKNVYVLVVPFEIVQGIVAKEVAKMERDEEEMREDVKSNMRPIRASPLSYITFNPSFLDWHPA